MPEVRKPKLARWAAAWRPASAIALSLGSLMVCAQAHATPQIDALYNAAKPYMGTEALPVKIPGIGLTLKLGKQDIDTLYAYIQEGIR